MARVTATPNRAARRAAAAKVDTQVGALPPAPLGAVTKADTLHPAAPAVAIEEAAPATEVLPDPTLVARPNAPLPIVTASPPLAAEPNAVDVARAQTDAAARDAGIARDPSVDHKPDAVVSGQPTLTIEPGAFGKFDMADASDDDLRRLRDMGAALRADPEAMAFVRRELFDGDVPPGTSTDRHTAVIEIVGPREGRRRCGFAFGPEPRRFLARQLTATQIEAIRADPLLTVGISELSIDELVDAGLLPRI